MKTTIWQNDKYEIKYGGMDKGGDNNWQHIIWILNNTNKSTCAIERLAENDPVKEVKLVVDNIITNVKELEDYREEIEYKLNQWLVSLN